MLKILFYNPREEISKACLPGIRELDIKCISVNSTRLVQRIKQLGITQIPTLYCKNGNDIRILIGDQILHFLQSINNVDQEEIQDENSELASTEVLQASHAPEREEREDSEEEIDVSKLLKK